MKNMKYLRTWLVVALVVTIIGSLTGGTVAWFTDSVESTGNIIESGTLDVKLYAVDKKLYDEANGAFEWNENHEIKNDSPALFDYKLWEPGYTSVKYVKIENAGNLAFKWHLKVKPAMSLEFGNPESTLLKDTETLAKAIDVYFAPAGTYNTFADLKAVSEVYNLYDLATASMADPDGAVHGVLLPKGEVYADDATEEYKQYVKIEKTDDLVIALHMKEEAGNECQGLSISDGFVIELRAAQYMYEEDSFGIDYDKLADNDMPSAFVQKLTAEQLASYTVTDIDNNDIDLEAGYMFATTDPSAANNSHALWHADFVVSFDKDVSPNTIGLAGQYTEWGEAWVAIPLNTKCVEGLYNKGIISSATAIPANEEIRLLQNGAYMLVDFDKEIYVNYEELCDRVVQFLCGVYKLDATAAGTTMTVKMNLYEAGDDPSTAGLENNYETGRYITAGQFQYTFE